MSKPLNQYEVRTSIQTLAVTMKVFFFSIKSIFWSSVSFPIKKSMTHYKRNLWHVFLFEDELSSLSAKSVGVLSNNFLGLVDDTLFSSFSFLCFIFLDFYCMLLIRWSNQVSFWVLLYAVNLPAFRYVQRLN